MMTLSTRQTTSIETFDDLLTELSVSQSIPDKITDKRQTCEIRSTETQRFPSVSLSITGNEVHFDRSAGRSDC